MILGYVLLANLIFFNLIFLLSVKKKNFGLIDIGWGLSFILIFWTAWFANNLETSWRVLTIGVLVSLWGIRLSLYLFYRNYKKQGKEDFRYANWRKEWGENANKTAYIRVFMLQTVLSILIASPLVMIHYWPDNQLNYNLFDLVGLNVWTWGFFWQAVADYQKNRFKAEPGNSSKICNVGLWKYSRHPNYFGEAMMWWGVFLLTLNIVPFYYGVWGPLLINFFLLKVSGVPLLEEAYKNRPEFTNYKKTTNRFIPWFPKKESL